MKLLGIDIRFPAFMGGDPPPSRDGYCACREPLTDSDVGAEGSGEDEESWCWRCRRPIDEATDARR